MVKIFHIIILVHILRLWVVAEECQLYPKFESSQNNNIDKSHLYFYIPIYSIGVTQNSINIFDEDGEILDCLNMKDFKQEIAISSEQPSFVAIKYITENTYVINYVNDDNYISVSLNSGHWYIVDDFFHIKYNAYFKIKIKYSLERNIQY